MLHFVDPNVERWRTLLEGLLRSEEVNPVQAVRLMTWCSVSLEEGEDLSRLSSPDALEVLSLVFETDFDSIVELLHRSMALDRRSRAHPDLPLDPDLLESVEQLEGVDSVVMQGPARPWLRRKTPPSFIRPPWDAFPHPPGSLGWRMGPGEDHMDLWGQYWGSLDRIGQLGHLADYPPPPDWKEWLRLTGRLPSG